MSHLASFYAIGALLLAGMLLTEETPRRTADWLALAACALLWPAFLIYTLWPRRR